MRMSERFATPVYSFRNKLSESVSDGAVNDDKALIQRMLTGCVKVEQSSELLNVAGVDYVATLGSQAQVLIDAKGRDPGCSEYWQVKEINGQKEKEPELALEDWSVKPNGKYNTPSQKAKIGWTFCEAKKTDMILFKFDPSDTMRVYLLPFQPLRMACRQFWNQWSVQFFGCNQDSGSWESHCVYVPVTVVIKAMMRVCISRRD